MVSAAVTSATEVEDVFDASMDLFRKEVSKVTDVEPTKIFKFGDDVNNC